ncbi:TetR/AcrR family transcriptional regulator [Nocardia goodfellowii]|uniref:AcrR family transcriptional regulator n=1 Tax=Nocardia goodfellowii TaxID=882446 RepID=A0ABS4QGA7_9NOCA|nr:TetR/AcrR family transcriptional regulator [Nocardia goodfellowii]MBP2190731.1 AcrR family transcriptional regulator [Nocardia goodfellowii]
MTNSVAGTKPGKRERLIEAAVRVFYERGVEKTTIADIARVADVPVGNVYYYFKTKDQLIEAAIGAHARTLDQLTAELNRLDSPRDRLKRLIDGWVEERELAARYGCPFGSLTAELHKRDDPLEGRASEVMRALVDWAAGQFDAMGRADAEQLAIALIASYQGISLLTNAFRDPDLMVAEGRRLQGWIDSL